MNGYLYGWHKAGLFKLKILGAQCPAFTNSQRTWQQFPLLLPRDWYYEIYCPGNWRFHITFKTGGNWEPSLPLWIWCSLVLGQIIGPLGQVLMTLIGSSSPSSFSAIWDLFRRGGVCQELNLGPCVCRTGAFPLSSGPSHLNSKKTIVHLLLDVWDTEPSLHLQMYQA